jgi:hypothetical protein
MAALGSKIFGVNRRPGAPDQVTDPVPSFAPPLLAYRFSVPHTHAGVHYAAGARVSLAESDAEHINDYVGAGTVLPDDGRWV